MSAVDFVRAQRLREEVESAREARQEAQEAEEEAEEALREVEETLAKGVPAADGKVFFVCTGTGNAIFNKGHCGAPYAVAQAEAFYTQNSCCGGITLTYFNTIECPDPACAAWTDITLPEGWTRTHTSPISSTERRAWRAGIDLGTLRPGTDDGALKRAAWRAARVRDDGRLYAGEDQLVTRTVTYTDAKGRERDRELRASE